MCILFTHNILNSIIQQCWDMLGIYLVSCHGLQRLHPLSVGIIVVVVDENTFMDL